MSQEDWEEKNVLARSTIMLSLSKDAYYNVKGTITSYELWQKLCNLYEQKSPRSQIYWLKKLVELKMKEGTPMSNHVNEFICIYSHLIAQEVNFSQPVEVLFLLITLLENWETSKTTINTSQEAGGLSKAIVTSNLLTWDINRKNND